MQGIEDFPVDCRILAVIPIFEQRLSGSPAIRSWLGASVHGRVDGFDFRLLICDNSLRMQSEAVRDIDLPASASYLRTGANEGVGGAYRRALASLKEDEYILLLDQDSSFDWGFLGQVTEVIRSQAQCVDAVVPQVVCNGQVISPLRGHLGTRQVRPGLDGVGFFRAINSGLTLRAGFLRSVGGFEPRFWLDGLDHWLMIVLASNRAKSAFVAATIQHDLSVAAGAWAVSDERYSIILMAELLLFRDYRSCSERMLYVFQLLWRLVRASKFGRVKAGMNVRQLFALLGRNDRRSPR